MSGTLWPASVDVDIAAEAFEEALKSQPTRAAEIHQALVQSNVILGMQGKANASLVWLEQEHARPLRLSMIEALVPAHAVVRENARALAIAQAGPRRVIADEGDYHADDETVGSNHHRAVETTAASLRLDRLSAMMGPNWRC